MSRQHPACFEVAASSPSEAGMNGCGGANLLMFTFVVIILTPQRSLVPITFTVIYVYDNSSLTSSVSRF